VTNPGAAPDGADAGQIQDGNSAAAEDTTGSEDDVAEHQDDADDAGKERGGTRPQREARLRQRAQTAEAERDQLRERLDALHRQTVDDIAAAAGLPDPALLHAAGHDVDAFLNDDGTVDRDSVVTAATEAMNRYGIPRRLRPNPQQGAHGGVPTAKGVNKVINDALGR
jgi:hypothetical protein